MFFCNNSVYATSLKVLGTMLLFCGTAVLVMKLDGVFGAAIGSEDGDKELLMAFVVHRHGERTPAEEEAALSKDVEKIKELIKVEGYEALTNQGKRRSWQIGKFIKSRYGPKGRNLISDYYTYDEILVRTTAKDRTKMTAQIAMAAVYPPEGAQRWDSGLGSAWQPVPYTAVPLSEDYLRYYSNCEHFKGLMARAKVEALSEEFASYSDLMALLQEKTGEDFRRDPLLFQTLYDLFLSQTNLGIAVPEWAVPIMPRLKEAAFLAYRLYFRTDEMKRIGGGVMLNDFQQLADAIASGSDVKQRLRVYSSHDFNIGSFMEVARVDNTHLGIPEYGAVFAMELYRSRSTGEFYVLPVYINQAGEKEDKLKFHGCCEDFFEYNNFKNLTSNNTLAERDFYDMCNIKTEL